MKMFITVTNSDGFKVHINYDRIVLYRAITEHEIAWAPSANTTIVIDGFGPLYVRETMHAIDRQFFGGGTVGWSQL